MASKPKSSKPAAKKQRAAKTAPKAKAAPAKEPARKAAPARPAAKPAHPAPAKKPVPAPVKVGRPSSRPVTGARALMRMATESTVEAQQTASAKHISNKEKKEYKDLLLRLRDRVSDEISFLANDNLNRSQRDSSGDLSSYSFHMADQGTDNFDREFAANLLSGEQDILYEIDDALRRLDQGTYGICEMSGQPIEKERLRVLPYARYCVAVQSEIERGRPKFRPFKRFSFQQASGESESR